MIQHFIFYHFYFVKSGKPQNISFTAEARRWLHLTYDKCFDIRTSLTYLAYSWRWSCHLFTYHTGPL